MSEVDVTDRTSIDAAVAAAPDVTVLINNAGAIPPSASLLDVADADIRANVETNFFARVFLARLRADPRCQAWVGPGRRALRCQLVRLRRRLQRVQGRVVVGHQLFAPQTRTQ